MIGDMDDRSDIKTAQALELSGEIVSALDLYRKAFLASPKDESAVLGIANCALALEDLPVALEFYVRLLILNHGNPWGYYGRASVLFRYGASAKACDDIALAMAYDDPATALRIDMAALLNANGFFERALCALEPLRGDLRLDPDFRIEFAFAKLVLRQIDEDEFVETMTYFEENSEEDDLYALFISSYRYQKHEIDEETFRAALRAIVEEEPDFAFYGDALLGSENGGE